MFQTNAQAPLAASNTPDKNFGFHDATVGGGWRVPEEPYSVRRRNQPGWHEATDWNALTTDQNWMWWRSRMLGGRTNHWGRISLRMGPYDFKPLERDGLGLDWPLGYDDMAPYYDKVEMLIGVYGSNEGLENTPDSPNRTLLPAPAPKAHELFTKKICDDMKIPVVPIHRAVLSAKQDHRTVPGRLHPHNAKAQKIIGNHMELRQACFWATPCGRGCSTRANYQSTTVHIPPALETGNLDIIPNAMVREVLLDEGGKTTGVVYIDKLTGREHSVKARIVVLAASGCESARILLNSKSNQFPNGLGNSSGMVGRYLMDTVGASVDGQIPALENLPPHNTDGAGVHCYIPWWKYREQLAGKLDFARGYHIEFNGGREMPKPGIAENITNITGGGYGKRFKEDMRRYYGSFMNFSGRGEMIPNENSYCEIDPDRKDKWGIPALRFHFQWSDHEIKQAAHMHKTFQEIIESMGGRVTSKIQTNGRKAIYPPGAIIHEVGTTCIGSDSKKSVLNQWCQSWDVKNLFVTDGGPFVSNADKNPTLSIMALAWRSADYMLEEMRKGNL
ncbi:MAG TPA: GMC family oxidoreductase, partial [Verrucomicrobia bacterium]|nr:GMC family oxidoreductase [Verrucomicrobiota bacterium]